MTGAHDRLARASCVATVLAAPRCGIQPDASPRDVPDDERTLVDLAGVDRAAPRRVPTASTSPAPGDDRALRSVPHRDAAISPTTSSGSLLAGPNDDEIAAQYTHVHPARRSSCIGTSTQGDGPPASTSTTRSPSCAGRRAHRRRSPRSCTRRPSSTVSSARAAHRRRRTALVADGRTASCTTMPLTHLRLPRLRARRRSPRTRRCRWRPSGTA